MTSLCWLLPLPLSSKKTSFPDPATLFSFKRMGRTCVKAKASHCLWSMVTMASQWPALKGLRPGIWGQWDSMFLSQKRKTLAFVPWQKSPTCQEDPMAKASNVGKEISFGKSTKHRVGQVLHSLPRMLNLAGDSGLQETKGHTGTLYWMPPALPQTHTCFISDGDEGFRLLHSCLNQIHSTLFGRAVFWCLWGNNDEKYKEVSYLISTDGHTDPSSN